MKAIIIALVLLPFLTVFAGVGITLMCAAVLYNYRSWARREPLTHKAGSLGGGLLIGFFGWVIVTGAWVSGAAIIDGLITRFSG